ncbi:MAG: ATP synthase F1 subunit gamma [Candidatus Berkelbacteria bacterium]
MPSTQEFRRRIKSVNNTRQITKAMEMIASVKMQKATKTIAAARSYVQNAWNMLQKLSASVLPDNHPLVSATKVNKTAVILITSDRGLCGGYNAEIIKRFIRFEKEECACSITDKKSACGDYSGSCDVIAIGKKGAEYTERYKIGRLIAEFPAFENDVQIEDIVAISKLTNGEYLAGHYDKVVAIYSHFESSIKQTGVVKQILPLSTNHIDKLDLWEADPDLETNNLENFKFEPSPDIVFEGILKQFLRVQIFGAILEANASEHSARMVAMKNATDNAKDLIDELQLIYNSVRQDSITREIAEISGAAEAMG